MSNAGKDARRGFEYQDWVAMQYLLRLEDDPELLTVEVEAVREADGGGSVRIDDIVLCRARGQRVYIQAKSSGPACRSWSIAALSAESELVKIIEQLKQGPDTRVRLYCPHGFAELQQIHQALAAVGSDAVVTGDVRQADKLAASLGLTVSELAGYLSRLEFGERHESASLIEQCKRRLDFLVAPDVALCVLKQHMLETVVNRNPGTRIDRELLRQWLKPLPRHAVEVVAASRERPWSMDALRGHERLNADRGELQFPVPGCGQYLELSLRPFHACDDKGRAVGREAPVLPMFDGVGEVVTARGQGLQARLRMRRQARRVARWLFWHRMEEETVAPVMTLGWAGGELTMRDAGYLPGRDLLDMEVEAHMGQALMAALAFYRSCEGAFPLQVRARINGIGAMETIAPPGQPYRPGERVPSREIMVTAELEVHDSETPLQLVLAPFFARLWKAFLFERPNGEAVEGSIPDLTSKTS